MFSPWRKKGQAAAVVAVVKLKAEALGRMRDEFTRRILAARDAKEITGEPRAELVRKSAL